MEPWFDDKMAGMWGGILGSVIGIVGGTVGGLTWIFIRKGWRKVYFSIYITINLACAGLLITGLVALIQKQPFWVWYVFLLPGVLGTALFSGLYPVINRRFTEQEMVQMQARDLCEVKRS